MKNATLVEEYADKIAPLIPLAQKAYGAKNQKTAAHEASREYTRLLVEFVAKKGSLTKLSQRLGVSYAGMRRRVITADLPAMKNTTDKGRRIVDQETIDAAVSRVAEAKKLSTRRYHAQLAKEYYETGVSLSAIAKGLGVANAGPLYYGVQRHVQRTSEYVA